MTGTNGRIETLNLRTQRGTALITVILVLLILTIIAIYGVNTSTVETMISGFLRHFKKAFYTADSGEPMGIKLTKTIIREVPENTSDLPSPWKDVVKDSNLLTEVFNDGRDSDTPTDSSPDVDSKGDSSNLGLPSTVRLKMDIDRLKAYPLPGGGVEFASGYEGIGGAGGGGVCIMFTMDSLGQSTLTDVEAGVEVGYRHIVGVPGGN